MTGSCGPENFGLGSDSQQGVSIHKIIIRQPHEFRVDRKLAASIPAQLFTVETYLIVDRKGLHPLAFNGRAEGAHLLAFGYIQPRPQPVV
jgi:hypothetical protein